MALLPRYNSNLNSLPLRRGVRRVCTERRTPKKLQTVGYAQVARLISTDNELAVYRRSDRTAARVVLALQSEILLKQKELDKLDERDAWNARDKRDPDLERRRFLAAATMYEENPGAREIRDNGKHRLLGELWADLKEYYDHLTAQSDVLKLSSPADRVKDVLTKWLEKEQCLVGLGEEAYSEDNKDFVALRPAKAKIDFLNS